MVADKRVIHFGYFVRWRRETVVRVPRSKLAARAEMSERRLADIEKMAEPTLYGSNMAKLSVALGLKPDELRTAWKEMPVPIPPKRRGRAFETVTLVLPRDVYDALVEQAAAMSRTPIEHIAIAAAGQTLRAVRPLPQTEQAAEEEVHGQR